MHRIHKYFKIIQKYIYREEKRMINENENLKRHNWGIWVKEIWSFFVIFSQLFCKFEITLK